MVVASWLEVCVVRWLTVLVLVVVSIALVMGASGSAGPAKALGASWSIRSLGTLGGPTSRASLITARGQVIGASMVVRAAYGLPAHAFLWQNGRMSDLGSLGGVRRGSYPSDVNESGEVVGSSAVAARLDHAFLWRRGTMRDLGTLGGRQSGATAINTRGQVVGQVDYSHAFLWENDRMRDLGTLGGARTEAVDINRRGQIVGSSDTKIVYRDTILEHATHTFLWQNGKMIDLGTLGGQSDSDGPAMINERGQIVGQSATNKKDNDGFPIMHAFLWQDGKMTDLGTLGGPESNATAINEQGQVIGWSDTTRGGVEHAFLWQHGTMTDLGTLGGPESDALAINEQGQIVGWGCVTKNGCVRHAFVWQDGKMTDLGTLGGFRSEATDINDYGYIVGSSDTRGRPQQPSVTRAALWSPRQP